MLIWIVLFTAISQFHLTKPSSFRQPHTPNCSPFLTFTEIPAYSEMVASRDGVVLQPLVIRSSVVGQVSSSKSLLRSFLLIFFLLPITVSWQSQASAGQLQLAWTDNA